MNIADRAWVATRAGLCALRQRGGAWHMERTSFLGDPVSTLPPPGAADHCMLAALNLGHFGVKLHTSDDVGATWHEVATPGYPPQPENDKGVPWKLVQV